MVRHALKRKHGLAATGAVVALLSLPMLSACGSNEALAPADTPDTSAYTKVIDNGPVASAMAVDASKWAQSIKKAGTLRLGSVDNVPLISMRNIEDGTVEGFDAGLSQLLARYILGTDEPAKHINLTNVTADTRETLLQNGTVDSVIITYSITPERAKKIAFAGPYYQSGDGILVKADNKDIKSVADLDGKTVATQSGSTGVAALQDNAPGAKIQEFQTDAQCIAAVQQGRVDAYVQDQSGLIVTAAGNKAVKVVGEPFTQDFYGIGLPKNQPDAKKFVNGFLTKIYTDGTWAKLWDATYGTVIEGNPPKPPALGSVDGS